MYKNIIYLNIICILILSFFSFIVTIESVGTLLPSVLFIEAIKILKGKCKTFLEELEHIGK